MRSAEKKAEPTAAIIDSQSVKTTQARTQVGYDAGKKIKGRKRHIAVDTLGLLLCVVVHSAGIQDSRGGRWLALRLSFLSKTLQQIWVDGGYKKGFVTWVLFWASGCVTVVKRSDVAKGFHVLPKRWIVERTFGWLNGYRRLSKDYEYHTRSSESHIHIAMIRRMVKLL